MPMFTKGPWEATIHIDEDGEPAQVEILTPDVMQNDPATALANANLIAAAPELYAACEAAFIRLPMTKYNEELNEQLKAAIAKARGDNL